MSIQQNQIVQPTYNGQDIYYRTPVDAIITDGMSLDDYIRNTTGVVESGSNTNGSYIKFADGTMICQGSKTFTSVACTSAYGGLYRSGASNQMDDFPIEFYDIPIVHFGVTEGSSSGNNATTGPIVMVFLKTNTDSTNQYVPTKTNPGRVSIAVGSSQTLSSITVSYTAIGRWKDYDASVLPDEQQSTIINSSSTNYYDDERVVGIWRDGKPLYRKVYAVTSINTINTGISWDTIVDAKMMSHQSTGQWRNIPWLFNSTDTTWMGGFFLSDSDHSIRFQLGSNLNNLSYAHIILLYTKTTDQPVTSQTKDLLTVVNGKNITDLETIIQQRISDTLIKNFESIIDNRIDSKMNSKILWSNSKPTSSFAQQNITLDSKDYNYLTWYYYNWVGGDDSNGGMRIESVKIPKGYNVNMTVSICISSGVEHLGTRGATYVSDTVYTVRNQGGYAFSGSQNTDNAWVVPIMVVGSNY